MSSDERRKYPRVFESVPCRVILGPSAFVTETKNLSCGGALCYLNSPLPIMTKLDVALLLPSGTESSATRSIRCVGVVVRREPPVGSTGSPSYPTAIYFSQLAQDDRRRIAEFVLQSMLSHDRRRS